MTRTIAAAMDRIDSKVSEVPFSGCWIWTGWLTGEGYGGLKFRGRTDLAHRVSYEAHRGPIPDGLQLDHLCRTRSCVNPWHLEPVTVAENLRRGIHHNRTKTHCKHGHPYDAANTWVIRGKRFCKACSASQRLRRRGVT